MVKRLILGVLIGVSLLAGTAAAQQSPPVTQPPVVTTTPPPTVLPTTIVPPTTTEAPTTTAVAPTTIERPTTTATVRGVVINRPLPRTGNDFGVQVVAGLVLTAAGLALAITARLRRQRLLGPASS